MSSVGARVPGIAFALALAAVGLAQGCGRASGATIDARVSATAAPTARAADATRANASDMRLGVGAHVKKFGTVGGHDELTHAFELENRSGRALQLKTASASCGCTRYEFDKKQWAAGERGTLTLRLDPSGKSGAVYATVSVIVIDDAGVEGFERFGLECIVERTEQLYVDPAQLDFGAVATASTHAEFSIGCFGQSEAPLPERVRWSSALLAEAGARTDDPSTLVLGNVTARLDAQGALRAVEFGEGRHVRARARVEWTPASSDEVLRRRLELEFVFPDGRVEPAALDVRGSVAPAVSFKPSGVFVPGLAAGESRAVSIAVEGAAAAADCVLTTTDASIRAEWDAAVEPPAAGARTLRVTVVAPSERRSIQGSVQLSMGAQTFRLPVSATIR